MGHLFCGVYELRRVGRLQVDLLVLHVFVILSAISAGAMRLDPFQRFDERVCRLLHRVYILIEPPGLHVEASGGIRSTRCGYSQQTD